MGLAEELKALEDALPNLSISGSENIVKSYKSGNSEFTYKEYLVALGFLTALKYTCVIND